MNYQDELNQIYRKGEYDFHNGDNFITFNIVDINADKSEITVAITDTGKISVCNYELMSDGDDLYFEYGIYCDAIYLCDFHKED